jgi:septum formation protein
MSFSWIYLASQSPRRQQLLNQLGARFKLLLPDAQEDAESFEVERPGEDPVHYVQRVTLAKLEAAIRRRQTQNLPPAPIFAADTTVALHGKIFGKPANSEDAIQTLLLLSGQTHQVLTAVALAAPQQEAVYSALQISRVQFGTWPLKDIEQYVRSGEPMGKAGSYAIQSQAARWIRHIEGSYSGIMGLPLFETAELLQRSGVIFGAS